MKKILLSVSLLFGLNLSAQALEVGDTAPCVVLNHLNPDGSEVTQCIREPNVDGQLKVLEFFSAFCSACRKNLPIFSGLHDEFGQGVTFRLIGIDRDETALRNYHSQFKSLINFQLALDTSRDAKRAYDVFETPTLYVLSADDVVLYKHSGVLQESDVQDLKNLFRNN